jgi:predicted tellurium resistance membrane protein TerC
MNAAEILLTIVALIVLEGLLSADNAIVLAVLVRPLPKHLQKRALLYGLIGGYVMRGLMLLFVTFLAQLWWAQVGGGVYLVFLAIKHFRRARQTARGQLPAGGAGVSGIDGDAIAGEAGAAISPEEPSFAPRDAAVSDHTAAAATTAGAASLTVASRTFWRTVATVELMDLAFAVDSALVAVALTTRLWVIYIGVGIGILMLRLAAGWFIGVLERHPRFEHIAFALVGWAGVKLLVEGWGSLTEVIHHPGLALHLPKAAFWAVTMTILIFGSIWALRHTAVDRDIDDHAA